MLQMMVLFLSIFKFLSGFFTDFRRRYVGNFGSVTRPRESGK